MEGKKRMREKNMDRKKKMDRREKMERKKKTMIERRRWTRRRRWRGGRIDWGIIRRVKQGKEKKVWKKRKERMRKACVCSHTLMLLHGQWGEGGGILNSVPCGM
jgi:hypothetical protein